MKKKVIFSGIISLSLLFSFCLGAFAAPKLSVWFNGKVQKTDVKMISNKPYVPLSEAATWFGGKVTFDKKANTYKVTSKDYDPNPPKSYNVNVTNTSGPMKITISKVTLNPAYKVDAYTPAFKAVILETKVQNTFGGKVSWHPAQGIFAFNTGEQVEGIETLMYSDKIGGDFLPNTTKTGKLVLKVSTSKLDEIKSIQANIQGPFDDELTSLGEELLFDVKFR